MDLTWVPPGPVSKQFMESGAFVRGIMGPLGSGKSTCCTIEILRRSQAQSATEFDGKMKRRTRWAIIRNSYPELKTTTIKTWNQWVPSHFGKMTFGSPIRHHVITEDLDMEILFLALDRPEDVSKLLSLELTGAWLNEAREIPKAIVDGLTGRVGRFPPVNQGGCDWSGILMDTNPPDDQSWWYQMAEANRPEGWDFFQQAGGMNVDAENIPNLPKKYYQRMIAGKDPDWIKVYVDGEYGFVTEGKPVYPMYRDHMHASKVRIDADPNLPLLIGVDFGIVPTAVIGQKHYNGRWVILDEYVSEEPGIKNFAKNLASYIAIKYPDITDVQGWGDPAGGTRSIDDGQTTGFDILKEYTGWNDTWGPAPGENVISTRLEVVIDALNRLVDGQPGIILNPDVSSLRKGFAGGYCRKFLKQGDGTQTMETPVKNRFSHPHDALQYLLLGAGEVSVVLRKDRKRRGRPKIIMASGLDFNPYSD